MDSVKNKSLGFAKVLLPLFFISLVLVLGGVGYYLYSQNQSLNEKLSQLESGNQQLSKDEVEKLVKEISKVAVLPQDEEPTVATVSDIESIKDQQFFKNAKNGDKVLIYGLSGRAVIYRQETGQIVEMARVSIESDGGIVAGASSVLGEGSGTNLISSEQETPEKLPEYTTVGLFSPTTDGSAIEIAIQAIKNAVDGVEFDVTALGRSKNTYERTIVVTRNPQFAPVAQSLALALGGITGDYPTNETEINYDIVIFVGGN